MTTKEWYFAEYYDQLVTSVQTEDDPVILQSIDAAIGWTNALRVYNIEPNDKDIKEAKELYEALKEN